MPSQKLSASVSMTARATSDSSSASVSRPTMRERRRRASARGSPPVDSQAFVHELHIDRGANMSGEAVQAAFAVGFERRELARRSETAGIAGSGEEGVAEPVVTEQPMDVGAKGVGSNSA